MSRDASVAAQAGMDLSMTRGSGMRLITRSFVCSDDEYIGIHTGAVGAFGRLMQVLGLDDRIPPSETGIDMGTPLTPEQAELLERELHPRFASQPRAYWVERLMAADVCAVEHLHPTEVFDEPQPRHNGWWRRSTTRCSARSSRSHPRSVLDAMVPERVASGAHTRPAHRRDPRRARVERPFRPRPLRSAPPTNVHCCTT